MSDGHNEEDEPGYMTCDATVPLLSKSTARIQSAVQQPEQSCSLATNPLTKISKVLTQDQIDRRMSYVEDNSQFSPAQEQFPTDASSSQNNPACDKVCKITFAGRKEGRAAEGLIALHKHYEELVSLMEDSKATDKEPGSSTQRVRISKLRPDFSELEKDHLMHRALFNTKAAQICTENTLNARMQLEKSEKLEPTIKMASSSTPQVPEDPSFGTGVHTLMHCESALTLATDSIPSLRMLANTENTDARHVAGQRSDKVPYKTDVCCRESIEKYSESTDSAHYDVQTSKTLKDDNYCEIFGEKEVIKSKNYMKVNSTKVKALERCALVPAFAESQVLPDQSNIDQETRAASVVSELEACPFQISAFLQNERRKENTGRLDTTPSDCQGTNSTSNCACFIQSEHRQSSREAGDAECSVKDNVGTIDSCCREGSSHVEEKSSKMTDTKDVAVSPPDMSIAAGYGPLCKVVASLAVRASLRRWALCGASCVAAIASGPEEEGAFGRIYRLRDGPSSEFALKVFKTLQSRSARGSLASTACNSNGKSAYGIQGSTLANIQALVELFHLLRCKDLEQVKRLTSRGIVYWNQEL